MKLYKPKMSLSIFNTKYAFSKYKIAGTMSFKEMYIFIENTDTLIYLNFLSKTSDYAGYHVLYSLEKNCKVFVSDEFLMEPRRFEVL